MSLKETMSDWKKQAEEEAEQNLNRQGQNNQISDETKNILDLSTQNQPEQNQLTTVSPAELQNLINSAVEKAVEEKTKESQWRESNLETKLDENNHQLIQLRLQQKQKNDSLKQETENLRKETKDSFDGLGNLIEEKMKPLDELNRKMAKRLPPSPPSNQPDRKQLNGSTKKNISDDWSGSEKQNYSINYPSVTYIPSQQSNQSAEANYRQPARRTYPDYQEPEILLPRWMVWIETIFQIPFFLLWLTGQFFKLLWTIFKGILFTAMIMPEVVFPFLIFVAGITIFLLALWGIPYLIPKPTSPFRMIR